MPVEYLVDASALYALVAHYDKWIRHRDRLAILHLTIYEAGNALWKEARLGRVDYTPFLLSGRPGGYGAHTGAAACMGRATPGGLAPPRPADPGLRPVLGGRPARPGAGWGAVTPSWQ